MARSSRKAAQGKVSAEAPAPPKPKARKPAAKPAAKAVRSGGSYTSPHVGLRVTTPIGPVEFEDGTFTTRDPNVALTLDGLAVERPDLVTKKE